MFKGVSAVDVSINWKDHYSASKLVDVCLEGFISYEEFKVDHFAELFFKIIEFFNFNTTDLRVVVVLQCLIVVVFDGNDSRSEN
jgi:hypothetical protein